MMLLELLRGFVSELGIVTAYLPQYIPIYTSGITMELSLSPIFIGLIVYVLLLLFLSSGRVFVGTIPTPSWTSFPHRGDSGIAAVVALLAATVAIDYILFTGILS